MSDSNSISMATNFAFVYKQKMVNEQIVLTNSQS